MPTFEQTPLSPDSTSDFAQPQFINGKFHNPKSFINWKTHNLSKIFVSKDKKGIPSDPAVFLHEFILLNQFSETR